MPYVQRTPDGKITGLSTGPQPNTPVEFLPDNDAEVIAYNTPPALSTILADIVAILVGTAQEKAEAEIRLRAGRP